MVTCERFEQDYEAWRKGELTTEESDVFQKHLDTCNNCQHFAESFSTLRQYLVAMPQQEPSVRFKYQLNRKINDINTGDYKERSFVNVFPRWAAVGAGIATGFTLALVVIILNIDSGTNNTQMMADKPKAESHEQFASNEIPDSTVQNSDTMNVPESNYRLDKYSQAVSSEY
ncbi:zf-HC2 domain-containing protein [bacterium]|nr:zf-HC2 domain-containing protein [bacterium]